MSNYPSTPVQVWEVETTDTFGGERNYSWVERVTVVTPALDNHRIIRMLRAAAGLTGSRARLQDNGYYLAWKHPHACIETIARPLD